MRHLRQRDFKCYWWIYLWLVELLTWCYQRWKNCKKSARKYIVWYGRRHGYLLSTRYLAVAIIGRLNLAWLCNCIYVTVTLKYIIFYWSLQYLRVLLEVVSNPLHTIFYNVWDEQPSNFSLYNHHCSFGFSLSLFVLRKMTFWENECHDISQMLQFLSQLAEIFQCIIVTIVDFKKMKYCDTYDCLTI